MNQTLHTLLLKPLQFYKSLTFSCVALVIMAIISNSANASSTAYSNINKFAWVASLQSIKFLPLQSADPVAGVIISDWFSVDTNTRYKVDVYVLSGILNAESVNVSVFKQVKQGGSWVDVKVPNQVSEKLTDVILNKARLLRNHADL